MSAILERYRLAASRFLQSAVVIDDRAALVPEDDEVVPDVIADPRPRPTEVDKEEEKAQAQLGAEDEERAVKQGETEENRLDARVLLDEFASLGMVCGVLRPGTDADATKRLALAAGARTDMVILDWHLDDSGARALRMLDELSQPESKRLRLVCIYTGDGSGQVTAAIAALDRNEEIGEFCYQRGNTRVIVLYKRGAERTGAPPERVVNVSDLPDRLLSEFASLCAGLVSAAAMSALGAIREAMPEILGVLVPELDAGYVGQRLSQERPDDAIDHLAELVASEVQSVIEDDEAFATIAGELTVKSWLENEDDCQRLPVELDAVLEMNRRGGHKNVRTEIGESYPKFSQRKKRPTELVVNDSDKALLADARLAERMTTRHRYPNAKRMRLELGTIVESGEDDKWWLCVLPLCDSVRLEKRTRVPFLRYEEILLNDETSDRSNPDRSNPDRSNPDRSKPGRHNIDLAMVRSGSVRLFHLLLEPSEIRHFEFEPDQVEKSIFLTTDHGTPRFIDTDDRSWNFVCRLKTTYAQRIAHDLGAKFSRVGLNESEWLRTLVR